MEYLKTSDTDSAAWERYRNYLDSVRDRMPPEVYTFAMDECIDTTSPSSLHDAWLESIRAMEIASGDRQQIRHLEIRLCLLGPHHDRKIHLVYTGVILYKIAGLAKNGNTAHGDLIAHEVRVSETGKIIHELLFETQSTIFIECTNIFKSEEQISGVSG